MYTYIFTHVDDFITVYSKSKSSTKETQYVYVAKYSSKVEPDYHNGNDYKKNKRVWCWIGCKKYLVKSIICIESIFGYIAYKNTLV